MQEITKPNQTVMIDPNEPLILPDGTALTGRIEWFLYSLCLLDYENLPTPMSRIEQFANALVTGEVPNIEPQSRVEEYFLAILTGDVENLPEPESRVEVLLDKLARGEFDLSDVEPIQSRYELLIAYLIKNSGIGDITYVLHEFLASDTPYTMYNTKEKPTKSAILSGQTLVNLVGKFRNTNNIATGATCDEEYIIIPEESSAHRQHYYMKEKGELDLFKPSTTYTVRAEIVENTLTQPFVLINGYQGSKGDISAQVVEIPLGFKGVFKATFTTVDNTLWGERSRLGFLTGVTNTGSFKMKNNWVVVEGDYTNQDIPYFDGMQSVKMPVLTTSNEDGTKTNILTVNEEVELGSVGDVKDELNLLTGELTQRTREVAYSNDMKISLYTPKENSFYLIFGDKLTSAERLIIADKIPHTSNWSSFINNPNLSCYSLANTYLYITIPSVGTVDEAKQYLSNLNPIFRYVLATESVKTVDLSILDQDGATVEKLNTFKDITHVSCSVDEGSIYPYVEMEVATSNDEDLAAIGLKLEEKNKVQSKLIKVNDYQSDVIDNVMLGITEIYESI